MKEFYFFEKTGCINNAKQKEILTLAGYDYTPVDIIKHNWTKEELLSFFGNLSVEKWFNRKSPRVKSNEIIPENYNSKEALELLLEDHLLIKRPLIKIDKNFLVGFDMEKIEALAGAHDKNVDDKKYNNLINQDLETCPQEKNNLPSCD